MEQRSSGDHGRGVSAMFCTNLLCWAFLKLVVLGGVEQRRRTKGGKAEAERKVRVKIRKPGRQERIGHSQGWGRGLGLGGREGLSTDDADERR